MSDLFDSLLELPPSSAPSSPQPATTDLPTTPANTAATEDAATREEAPSQAANSALSTLSAGQKRRAEDDLIQYAERTARRVRLRPAGQQELQDVARLSPDERSVWLAARLLKNEQHLEVIQPADAQWLLPKGLKDKIDLYTFLILLSPELPAYLKNSVPVKRMKTLLEQHPQWGYTAEVRGDSYKNEIVMKRIQERFTDRRAEIKQLLWLSLGPQMQSSTASKKTRAAALQIDILTLCENIADKHSAVMFKPTLELCARLALLRRVLIEVLTESTLNVKDYWDRVDDRLEHIRGMFPNEPRKVTKLFMNILDADKKELGEPSTLPSARGKDPSTVPSQIQALADNAAGGFAEDIRED
ncbi:uncharacterized protein C8Q71DRAFT_721730 [Rhodofomes roseus]|uniref:Uncharacterized protein n=1 Tax=Rhodofomes roseus TaxID=34475 RepID=A0ABQ8KPZ4_9APHY|nr:uncharacterized protein C8Q71DRAFT_721730 [Rhodofomes roseus]KAH9839932.1 hypothetical protein C8Q71DRAFT_721730 [Rhodofomes roseus]